MVANLDKNDRISLLKRGLAMSINRDQTNNIIRADWHNSLGIELANRGWLEEAAKEFSNAIENVPDCSDTYDNIASVYSDNGELLKALDAYVQALRIDPNNAYVLHNLGCFLSNNGNELAARCFTDASLLDSDLYESNFNLGLCFASEEHHEKAILQFEKALEKNSCDLEVRLHLALSLMALDKFVKAIKELRIITSQDEQNEEAWFNLGLCYNQQGFLEEAQKAFSKAMYINPNRIEILLSCASLLMRRGEVKEAKKLIKQSKLLDLKNTIDFMDQDEYLFKLSK